MAVERGVVTTARGLPALLLVGVSYLVFGVGFGALAGRAGSHQMLVMWRLAAWLASAVAFAGHIGYEHFRLRSSARVTAMHAALAVALGALGLAVAANLHALVVGASPHRGRLIALVAWPVLCGLPAFVVALAAAAGLAWTTRGER